MDEKQVVDKLESLRVLSQQRQVAIYKLEADIERYQHELVSLWKELEEYGISDLDSLSSSITEKEAEVVALTGKAEEAMLGLSGLLNQ